MTLTRRQAIALGATGVGLGPLGALAAPVPGPAITRLRVCGLDSPLALGALPPRLSWQVSARQVAYRLIVARSRDDLARRTGLLWDSGRIASAQSVDVAYGGAPLPSRSRAVWQVEVWTNHAAAPLVSAPAQWETGLGAQDWQGDWIASETQVAKADRTAGLHWITGRAAVKTGVQRQYRWTFDAAEAGLAELCLSAHDLAGLWLNGQPLTAAGPDPVRWTQMAVYPVTLAKGRNVLAVAVTRRTGFGVPPPVLAVLLRHGAGLGERATTADAGWKAAVGAPEGWHLPGFADQDWPAAIPATGTLPIGEPWPVTPASRLRKRFDADRTVVSARLHATALGVYQPQINGQPLDDRKLAPEFTDPSKRVLYQTWDVTERIMPGANMLGFEVADGWYGGRFSNSGRFAFGPAPCRLLAQLEIDYADGTRQIVATGQGWQIADSPMLAASIYDGEIHDARADQPGWCLPGAGDAGWRPADIAPTPKVAVEPQRCPPIRVRQDLAPVSVRRLGPGRHVVDFGQNFAGWVRLSVTAAAGTRIELRHGEVLNADGSVDQANLRSALARDVYICAGTGRETWEPRFTYHGFRYVEIRGLPDDSVWSVTGRVGHQDLDMIGDFRVGDPVIQAFWHNAVWSQKANFFGLPTDCPQRDERLGWMGDAEVFWPAAAFVMDVGAYTARVMEDVRHGQSAKGGFPDCIPPFVPTMNLSSPGWADAGIILPHTAWQQTGDTGVITASWAAMEAYMGWIAAANPGLVWKTGRGADYGDWLSVDANPANPGDATTPKDLIGTAFWAADAMMMADMAAAIGNSAAQDGYRALFEAIRQAFNAAYVHADGSVGNDSQTSHVLAIRFGLLTPERARQSAARLATDIARRGGHLSTGFLGTPHILDALAAGGQEAAAIGLLLQRGYPSWGYMVDHGATSIWERWNSDAGDVSMNSRNHYAFGAIGSFLFRRVAGIAPARPGFARVTIAPIFDARLGHAGATCRSVHGPIRTDWRVAAGRYRLDVELPAGVEGSVVLPGGHRAQAKPGPNRFSGPV